MGTTWQDERFSLFSYQKKRSRGLRPPVTSRDVSPVTSMAIRAKASPDLGGKTIPGDPRGGFFPFFCQARDLGLKGEDSWKGFEIFVPSFESLAGADRRGMSWNEPELKHPLGIPFSSFPTPTKKNKHHRNC